MKCYFLQGYLLGNALTTRRENNYRIPFSHGMGLISDELYNVIYSNSSTAIPKICVQENQMLTKLSCYNEKSLQNNCKGEYIDVDTKNVLCTRDMELFNEVRIFDLCLPDFRW